MVTTDTGPEPDFGSGMHVAMDNTLAPDLAEFHPRILHQPVRNPYDPADWTGWELTCYGNPVEEFDTLDLAFDLGAQHIRACPQGAMPWAETVAWHSPESLEPAWAASANGEWLNHTIRPIPVEATS